MIELKIMNRKTHKLPLSVTLITAIPFLLVTALAMLMQKVRFS